MTFSFCIQTEQRQENSVCAVWTRAGLKPGAYIGSVSADGPGVVETDVSLLALDAVYKQAQVGGGRRMRQCAGG
jgi:hypothetical protein